MEEIRFDVIWHLKLNDWEKANGDIATGDQALLRNGKWFRVEDPFKVAHQTNWKCLSENVGAQN